MLNSTKGHRRNVWRVPTAGKHDVVVVALLPFDNEPLGYLAGLNVQRFALHCSKNGYTKMTVMNAIFDMQRWQCAKTTVTDFVWMLCFF